MQYNIRILFYIVLIQLINFPLFIYVKYDINGLSPFSFDVFQIGNMLNVIIIILFMIASILHYFKKSKPAAKFYWLIFTISIVQFTAILLLKMNSFIPIYDFDIHLGYFSIKKLVNTALLFINQSLLIFIITLLWKRIFSDSIVILAKAIGITFTIFAVLFVLTFIYEFVFKKIETNNANKVDVGVVLGAAVWNNSEPSPILKGRIDKAIDLYNENLINNFQLTGGNAPGEISEAESAKRYLLKKISISNERVFVESKTTTTIEQIKFMNENLKDNYSILVISDSFHLPRVVELARFFNLKITIAKSNYTISWEKLLYYKARESIALLIFWILGV